MNTKRKQGLKLMKWGGVILVFCILFQIFFSNTSLKKTTITVGERTYELEKLVTEAEKVKGLSGRANLPAEKGLLFVFEKPSMTGFWMKEMNFPISIIWLDDLCKVTGFKKLATPESYPEVFYPELPSVYVVEVNPISVEPIIGETLKCSFLPK